MGTQNQNKNQNSWAVPALIAGIVSVFFGDFFIPSIAAIVLGSMGIGRSTFLQNNDVTKTGKGMSIAGLVLGIVYLLIGFYHWM